MRTPLFARPSVGLNSIQFNLMVRLPMYSPGGFALHACTLTPER